MKALIALICIFSTSVMGKDVKDFNKALMEKVNKDLNQNNIDQFQMKSPRPLRRGPASVETDKTPEPDSKIDKNVRQTGHSQW